MRNVLWAALWVPMVAVLFGCGSSAEDSAETDPVEMFDNGSWYVHERWPHDGRPVESENFVVYSDGASLEARREVAEVAEALWAGLLEDFSIGPGVLRYPEAQDKLHVYAYKDYNPRDWGARAYYGGLIIWSPDHGEQLNVGSRFAMVLKHELVHVLELLITNRGDVHLDVWFIEGLSEAMSGGTTGGAIRGLDELGDLTDRYGTVSPISLKTYSQIASPEVGERFNYPMFQLAVEYLLDDDGLGRSLVDMRNLIIDVADGESFEAAFEDRMGISLDAYESEFFILMEGYLPDYRNPLFSPVGFAVVSALVLVFVIGVPASGYRRWRLGAPAASIDKAAPGRRARIGFFSETTAACVIIAVCFLGALFTVGTVNELNNTMFAQVRTRAYWALAAYLLASVGLVLWAVNRWAHHSRAAFLVAPLVVIATGTTFLVFGLSVIR